MSEEMYKGYKIIYHKDNVKVRPRIWFDVYKDGIADREHLAGTGWAEQWENTAQEGHKLVELIIKQKEVK